MKKPTCYKAKNHNTGSFLDFDKPKKHGVKAHDFATLATQASCTNAGAAT